MKKIREVISWVISEKKFISMFENNCRVTECSRLKKDVEKHILTKTKLNKIIRIESLHFLRSYLKFLVYLFD